MRFTTKGLFVFINCLLLSVNTYGQLTSPLFYYLTADDGIASDRTTCVYQDRIGFVWIGTEEGLTKLNGYYDPVNMISDRSDPYTISNSNITSINEDGLGNLWVGTKNGINRYDRGKDRFIRYFQGNGKNELSGKIITDLAVDPDGDLWVATSNGLNKYVTDGNYFIQFSEGFTHLENEYIRALEIDSNGVLWIATNSGLIKYENQTFDKSDLVQSSCKINSIEYDSKGKLWFGLHGCGLVNYDYQTEKITTYQRDGQLRSLVSDFVNHINLTSDGKVWVSTSNGISIYDPLLDNFISHQYDPSNYNSLADYVVYQTYEDQSDGLWIATQSGGVNLFHKADNQFKYITQNSINSNSLADTQILSIYGDDNNELWIGSRLGLTHLDSKGVYHHYSKSETDQVNNHILSIVPDEEGNLWLGTSNGLSYFNRSSKKYTDFFNEELDPEYSVQVNVVLLGSKNKLWVGTDEHGLLLFNTMTKTFENSVLKEGSAVISKINTLLKDNEGTIWIGTDKGIFYSTGEQNAMIPFSYKDSEGEIVELWVNHLYEDTQQRIWGGAKRDGLFQLSKDDQSFNFYSKDDGLVSNSVNSVLEDPDGNLWISSNSGVAKMEMLSNGQPTFTNYTRNDGLQGTQFVPGSGVTYKDECVLFGGLQGLTIITPNELDPYERDFPVILTSLKINNETIFIEGPDSILIEDISLTKELDLTSKQTDITVEFTALDYLRPDSVRYRYKLNGYETDWNYLSLFNNAAVYTNLPRDREYSFVVEAKSRFSGWNKATPLKIYIQPAFYELIWFRIMLIIGLLSLFTSIYFIRNNAIRRKNEKLSELINERTSELNIQIEQGKEKERELQTAKEIAENANKTKSQFLANMSHEMRTPLNGISGLTSVMIEKVKNDENRKFLKSIEKSANSLNNLIDDLLDLSKIEAGKFELTEIMFDISRLIDETVSNFQTEARIKSIRLSCLSHHESLKFLGDSQRIQQVFNNLISNALKFTHKGGSVSIGYEIKNQNGDYYLSASVADTGIGIPNDHLGKIFGTFEQVDQGTSVNYGGSGLGLSICQTIVEKMNGRIWVDSQLGKGSTFYFEIQLKAVDENVETKTIRDSRDTDLKGTEPTIWGNVGTVLIVEDNDLNQLVAQQILSTMGIESETAKNGLEAIELLSDNNYTLVLMDVQMPKMDGFEATHAIRESQLDSGIDSNIPIIAVTAYALEGDREKCISAGMNDYVSKPLTIESLSPIFETWLAEDSIQV